LNRFFELIKSELPGIDKSDLSTPIYDSSIDSIDLLFIRVILEKKVGRIPDKVWNNFDSIQQAIEYCIEKQTTKVLSNKGPRNIVVEKGCEINMPQMANGCLSENWLFKELGDIHWKLLCKGLNTKSSLLKDDNDNRLYATFVRIQIIHNSLSSYKENASLSFRGSIKRFGNSTYISSIKGNCDGMPIEAKLMTNFSVRSEEDNANLSKSKPSVSDNCVPEYTSNPIFFSDYRLAKKQLLEAFKVKGIQFELNNEVVYETEYDINPYYEINGVDLLYFASYPIISDVCEARYFNKESSGVRWEKRYCTELRDVFYFSNCNIHDKIIFKLNSYEYIEGGKIKLSSALYRKSDGKLMARIYTVKKQIIN
jgi:probable biosynthetic protein (TIGR04098 family)